MKFKLNLTTEDGEELNTENIDSEEMNWDTQPIRHTIINEMFTYIHYRIEKEEGKVRLTPKSFRDIYDYLTTEWPGASGEEMVKQSSLHLISDKLKCNIRDLVEICELDDGWEIIDDAQTRKMKFIKRSMDEEERDELLWYKLHNIDLAFNVIDGVEGFIFKKQDMNRLIELLCLPFIMNRIAYENR